MKGMYFVDQNNDAHQIISEPLALNDQGEPIIEVVIMRLTDNMCDVYNVSNIRTLYTDKSHLPKEHRD